jgi:hypothetical protein
LLIIYNFRPQNKEELFNLCHASACNVIEHIFGVLKKCFTVLLLPPEYNMDIQAQIPPALCAIHNFIRRHDPDELQDVIDDLSDEDDGGDIFVGELACGPPDNEARDRAHDKRDKIAEAMWNDYTTYLAQRGEEL